MEKAKIDRINELARLKKERELTSEELQERDLLRKEYIADFRANMHSVLSNVKIQQEDGSLTPLQKKEDKH